MSCADCPVGHYCPSGLKIVCGVNTYTGSLGMSSCTSCPLNSSSSTGSIAKSACNCNAGYYRDIDGNCIACPAGYKCTGNNLMTACGPGTAAQVGMSVCTSCTAGSYSDTYAMGACLTCPAGPIVSLASEVVLGNGGADRANHPTNNGYLYIQRKPLPGETNLTKWSFYAFQGCTVTPVIAGTPGAVGNTGYDTMSFKVSTVGTTRNVPAAGTYTYDFLEGQILKTKKFSGAEGNVYYDFSYLGWYFQGPACIPYDITAADANANNDYIVQYSAYDPLVALTLQTFTDTITLHQNMRYSVSLTSVVTDSFFSSAASSTTIYNCSCGSDLRRLSDGNCQGLCIGGMYMEKDTDPTCTTCPRGSFCTNSIKTACAADTSAPLGSLQCMPCIGPNTHSDVSLAMCGLKTCPATAAVTLPGTPWKGLGRITLGLGGNGIIPNTPWFAAYKCLGLVLNATADRPVSLVYQSLSVTPNQSYALRFKVVCTGAQCGAGFTVTQGGNTIYSSSSVSRSWTEAATPYFTTTGTLVTIQFKAQMVTSSCTLWLAQVELVDLGQWSYPSISALRLQNGAFLPVRYSADYVESTQLVPMQISGSNYLQQTAAVLSNKKYEMSYWVQGAVDSFYYNGSGWTHMDLKDPIDNVAEWTQRVFHVTPSTTELKVRFVGPGTLSPPTLSLFVELASRPCMNCLSGYWCKGATMNKCPLNTDSAVGSSKQTDCFCTPGYYGQVQLGVSNGYSPCAICPMNFYCDGGNLMAPCPAGTKSQPGSALAGCVSCPAGELCENGLVGICPANSYAPSGSNDVGDCECMPGFYGTMGACTQCESGFYCPGGSSKLTCTANAVSPPGSTATSQCFCDRGYYGVNNTACTSCPEGSWCWTGIKNECPANTWSETMSSFQLNCICTYGYTGPNGGACSACSQGYFKPLRGPGTCTACGLGTSSTATAAISSSVCAMCNRGQFNPYTGQSGCLACSAGTNADAFGSVSCTTCPAGGWSSSGSATCIPCSAGTFSDSSSASGSGTCKSCPTGHWSASNSVACNECGACSYWTWPMRVTAANQGDAQLILDQSTSSTQTFMTLVNTTHAIMSSGMEIAYLNIATGATQAIMYSSVESVAYTYIEASRDRKSIFLVQASISKLVLPTVEAPVYELLHQYATTNPMGCTEGFDGITLWVTQSNGLVAFNMGEETSAAAIPYPSALTGVTASPCMHASYPDFVFVVGKAVSGVFGFRKYKISTGTWSVVSTVLSSLIKCTFTPEGNFAIVTSASGPWMYSLTEDSYANFFSGSINSVLVDPLSTFLLLSGTGVGIFKQRIIIKDARTCSPGLYSATGALPSADQCSTCPAGSLCPGGANITQCLPGTFSNSAGLRAQGQCSACAAGRYCIGGTSNQLCPLGTYSLAARVTKVADCGLCPAGFYCPNATVVVACPSNTFSPSGSSDLTSCTCNAGYRCEVVKVVHAEITLPITILAFEDLRQAYINAVAAAAGVDPSQVIIVSVTSTSPTGLRRLLSRTEYVEVHTSIYGSKHVAHPLLALTMLQRHLVIRGLPRHESNMRITLHSEVTHSMKHR